MFLVSISLTSFGQKDVDTKAMIGYGCYSGGSQSESVIKFSKLFYKSKFKKFVKLLDSRNNAEKVLSAFICEKLAEKGKIKLDSESLEKIKSIKNSEQLVSVCSGCTYFDKITMKQFFLKDESNFMLDSADFWFDYISNQTAGNTR